VLSLRILSIAAGAEIDVKDDNRGTPRFIRYRPGPTERARIACGEALPIAPNDCPASPMAEATE
jgi:hypothetical protein